MKHKRGTDAVKTALASTGEPAENERLNIRTRVFGRYPSVRKNVTREDSNDGNSEGVS